MQVVSKGWHNDKLVSKTADARLVLHYRAGKIGTSFRLVRSPDVVLTVFAEPGTGLAIDHELTLNPGVEHAHHPGVGGAPSLSIIIDIRKKVDGFEPLTEQALVDAAAAHARHPIDFDTFPWNFGDFEGSWRKGGVGGGSQQRVAVSALAGPVEGGRGTKRKRPLRDARKLAYAMSTEELAKLQGIPINRRFVALSDDPDLEAGNKRVRTYVKVPMWKQLPKDQRALENGGGARAKGASA